MTIPTYTIHYRKFNWSCISYIAVAKHINAFASDTIDDRFAISHRWII